MRVDGFTLHWVDSNGDWKAEPLIGWRQTNPAGNGLWLPVTPLNQNTEAGLYVLDFEQGGWRVAWTITNGSMAFYSTDINGAYSAGEPS
jgi:hypothetical protein